MNKKKLIYSALAILLVIVAYGVATFNGIYKDIQAGNIPHYEVGEHKGATFCAICHREIYDQWSQNSAHAIATTNEDFHDFKDKFTNVYMFNAMMGEELCYACHGDKEVNAGVDCETCHGIMPNNWSIAGTHTWKFSPRMEILKKQDFCAQCHVMKNPMSGDFIMSLYGEWQESEAASKNITCQGCHMKPRKSEVFYHGFDSTSHDVGIYRDDLILKDTKLDFPQFSLTIENRVTGHAIPATGPSRTLALEISFLDSKGDETYKIVQTFQKKFTLMPVVGLMPFKLIENTQLQSGEVRPLSYTLPSSLEGQVSKVVLTLRFYDVSDEYQGEINRAHWISEPFLEKEVIL